MQVAAGPDFFDVSEWNRLDCDTQLIAGGEIHELLECLRQHT